MCAQDLPNSCVAFHRLYKVQSSLSIPPRGPCAPAARVARSEHLRNALTTMLYHTGTPSKQFMLVLATNRPGDMDSAVIDRIDEAVGRRDVDEATHSRHPGEARYQNWVL